LDSVRYKNFQMSLADTPIVSDPLIPFEDDDPEYDPDVIVPRREEDSDSGAEDADTPAVPLQEVEFLAEDHLQGYTPLPNDPFRIHAATKDWAFTSSNLFTRTQLIKLREQMTQNMQLLAQTYVMQSELHGPDSPNAQHWRQQLEDLAENAKNAAQPSLHSVSGMEKVDVLLQLGISNVTPEAANFHERYNKLYNRQDLFMYRQRMEKNLPPSKVKPLDNTTTLNHVVTFFDDVFSNDLIPCIFPLKRSRAVCFFGFVWLIVRILRKKRTICYCMECRGLEKTSGRRFKLTFYLLVA
jgi:hypothetical protein